MRHPSRRPSVPSPLRLYGKRVMLRPLVAEDFGAWREVRATNDAWLTPWEPRRPSGPFDPTSDRAAFNARCAARARELSNDVSYGFGLFVDNRFGGEVNLNSVARGASQSATVGYWVDQRLAGRSLVAEGVVVLAEFAFERLLLHRIEICIVPRNRNSRRVVEKLQLRDEGVARGLVEINGVWEDHIRYALTAEEWAERARTLRQEWLTAT